MANFILNRGGAGVSISRQDTVDRLQPLARRLNEVHLQYVSVLPELAEASLRDRLEERLRIARMDIDKLDETIYSAGGRSAGTSEVGRVELRGSGDDGDGDAIKKLRQSENELLEMLHAEAKVKHHIRTQAILMNVETNSQDRLNILDEALERAGKSA